MGSFALIAAAPLARAQVSGRVVDRVTGERVAQAIVTVQATHERTTAGPDGGFVLPDVSGTSLVVAGAYKGYFIGSVRVTTPAAGVEIQLDPVPQHDSPSYTLRDPEFCGMCHPDQIEQWWANPMSKTGRNRWVHDMYNGTGTVGGAGGFVYTRDSAHAVKNPDSECASCHQPEPWIDQPFRALEPIDSPSSGPMHGVSCEVCHKVADVDETRMSFPGIYPGVVTVTRPEGEWEPPQVMYGNLGDADYNLPEMMRSSYQPQLATAVCGACHQDRNDPDQDGEFEEENGVVSESTWQEWLSSPYGDPSSPAYRTCADCHMPAFGAAILCTSLWPPLARPQDTIQSHRMEGTTAPFLENAVSLTMECAQVGDSLRVEVRIANDQSGHHVPTGTALRNMILLVEARRLEDGVVLPQLAGPVVDELAGVGDPNQGYYAGLPGKVYARIFHDASGSGPVFYTEATGVLWDSRIPVGAVDTTRYTFLIPDLVGRNHVRARLLYRRAVREWVDAKGWTEDGHGNPLADIQPPHYGHLMEEAEWIGEPVAAPETPSPVDPLVVESNPSRSHTRFRISLDMPGRAMLSIYDPSGRLIARPFDRVVANGVYAAEWSGRDRAGMAVSSGVYLARLEIEGNAPVSRRFVILR